MDNIKDIKKLWNVKLLLFLLLVLIFPKSFPSMNNQPLKYFYSYYSIINKN